MRSEGFPPGGILSFLSKATSLLGFTFPVGEEPLSCCYRVDDHINR
ncbi:hypothetical protein MPOCJGCO_0283 [Methylobacterium trifolii]|uniref:Uncharacterized protein n=1 Tax=Methylobacterium trifolii TaxID=1003092 RepID=A0ABQ4TUT1_9HYPH|nr:hypothetical protein MPOCJGCO_0283 [Methylobacterium trifolii]